MHETFDKCRNAIGISKLTGRTAPRIAPIDRAANSFTELNQYEELSSKNGKAWHKGLCHGAQVQNIRRPLLRPAEPDVQGVWAVPYAAALHSTPEDIHEVQHTLPFCT